MKWEDDTLYRIEAKEKKSVVYTKIYTWNDVTVRYCQTYRFGWVEVLGNDLQWFLDPDGEYGEDGVGRYNPEEGVDIWCMDPEKHEFLDVVSDQIEFSENADESEKERVMKSYESHGADGIGACSYIHYHTEVLFYGELAIAKK
jgi:hypothetical protein